MNTSTVLILLGLAVAAYATPVPVQFDGRYFFFGHFPGKCEKDGMYYFDPYSFVVCTNGNEYRQHCALGSANKPYANYHVGSYYVKSDFCAENLNDHRAPGYYHGYGPAYYGPAYYYGANPYRYYW